MTTRDYREANREKIREQRRRYYVANREKILESHRQWNRANSHRKHGARANGAFAAMWQAQDGRCYLCEKPLAREQAVIDHDHSCCPPRSSCSNCRRGLACTPCNLVIGLTVDDPDLLRKIADNLESVMKAVRDRIAAGPRQETLI